MLFHLYSSLTLETCIELLTVTSGWSLMHQMRSLSVTLLWQNNYFVFQKAIFYTANILRWSSHSKL